jgi:NAD(P)-dependent dehydrogenase (short-subunit alcohol dehydrogenase family)
MAARYPGERPAHFTWMAEDRRIAVVTGANRGIGLEVARQLAGDGFHVVMASRDAAKGEAAATALREDGLDVEARELDVADPAGVVAFGEAVARDHGRVDVLVNNAAGFYDTWQSGV